MFSLSLPTPTAQRSPFKADPPLAGLAGGTWPCWAPGAVSPSGTRKPAPSDTVHVTSHPPRCSPKLTGIFATRFLVWFHGFILFPPCKHKATPAKHRPCFPGSSTRPSHPLPHFHHPSFPLPAVPRLVSHASFIPAPSLLLGQPSGSCGSP